MGVNKCCRATSIAEKIEPLESWKVFMKLHYMKLK